MRRLFILIGLLSLLSGHSWGLVLVILAFFFMEDEDDE